MAQVKTTPEIIGRYELLTRLATGGMAELFLARERGLAGLQRLVVIKRILPHLAEEPSFVEMFLREARIVARLSHPNVVQIYELGQEGGTYYIAMEYIHGSTLRELLLLAQEKDLTVPLDVGLTVLDQACRGLHAAHELCGLDGKPLGLVHRDISPHNLMCTTEGHVKLLDFGVAKSTSASVEATYSGNLKGKFAYLSPEQCLHEPLDRRSDIFAMGIVMWEMFTMRRLFKRKTELDMMQAVIGGTVPPPTRFRPDLPGPVEEVILRALATDRDDRYDDAEALRRDLGAAAAECGVTLEENDVADFLTSAAGERLQERQATVESAVERELTHAERLRLLHMTGTSSRSVGESAGPDDATAVERPAGLDSATHQTPANQIKRLVESDRQRAQMRPGTQTAAAQQQEGASGQRVVRILVAAVITILVAAVIFLLLPDGEDETSIVEGGEAFAEEVVEPIITSGEPLPLGWAPTIDPRVLAEEVQPLHDYLERVTGRPIPLVMADSYTDLSNKLRKGEIAAAMLPPTLFIMTTTIDPNVEMLVYREYDGTVTSDAYLLVRRSDGISSLEELEGEMFCFVDQASTSGHLLPRHFIREQGYDPDEFIGNIHWSGDHFQSIRDLLSGRCKAAAVYSGAFLSADEYNIRAGQASTLALTGQLPQDVIAVNTSLPADDRALLRDALLDFDPEVEFGISRLGTNQRITGFLEEDQGHFDALREIILREGLTLDDL